MPLIIFRPRHSGAARAITGQLRWSDVARLSTSCKGPFPRLRPASGHGSGPRPKPESTTSLQSSRGLLYRCYKPDGISELATKSRKYYAVLVGRAPGVYAQWDGSNGALAQVKGFPGAKFKSYRTREEALHQLNAAGWPGQDAEGAARKQPTGLRASAQSSFWEAPIRLDLDAGAGGQDEEDTSPGQPESESPDTFQMSAPEEPVLTLSKEQQDAIDLAVNHRCNVFVTGSGGCGKSVFVREVRKKLHQKKLRVHTLAPTGQAALQVNGRTTWSYAGWNPNSPNDGLNGLIRRMIKRRQAMAHVTNTDVLIIDEISMIENFHFSQLSEAITTVRWDETKPKTWGPFGGIQMIVVGDFCQLPPVLPFRRCLLCGSEMEERSGEGGAKTYVCKANERHGQYRHDQKWAFKSEQWELCQFKHVHLVEVHRQSHKQFIAALQKIRLGAWLTDEDLKLLLEHEIEAQEGIRLSSRRDTAARINEDKFRELAGETKTYLCEDELRDKTLDVEEVGLLVKKTLGTTDQEEDELIEQTLEPEVVFRFVKGGQGKAVLESDLCEDDLIDKLSRREEAKRVQNERQATTFLKSHRFGSAVKLKIGMPVVLLTNLDIGGGLCNGSQGIVRGFEKAELPPELSWNWFVENIPRRYRWRAWEQAKLRRGRIESFMEAREPKSRIWPVVEFDRGKGSRTILPDCFITELGFDEPYSLVARTQVPLAPGWAMTIHKSQSLSLDRVTVDLANVFEGGQIYVALSRARTLSGLRIVGGDTLQNRYILRWRTRLDPEVRGFLRDKFPDVMEKYEFNTARL